MRVFISYRRDDAGERAARIATELRSRFGPEAVFLDVEAIEAGEDFVAAIERAIWDADVVVVVIGPRWMTAIDADGRRRLEDPKDYVRLEVEAALRRDVRIVPVLVGGASMPASDDLPGTLGPLSRRNALTLHDGRLEDELDELFIGFESDTGLGERDVVHLPAQPTPFIGREAEVADVRVRLERGDVRLLTLTGPGGAGKTRLAIEAASGLGARYPGGVWFVALAALRDPELVIPTIATTLGLHEGFGSDLQETLARFLRDRRVLLVIDNVEQLLPRAASILDDLLASGADTRMLISSREALGVRAEHTYPVGELGVDDAVTLFADRARSAVHGFELDVHGDAAAAICERLEGLPLAIELAAARVKLFSPAELLRRLDARLPVLTGGARDAPERQRTMRGAIAWSYDLLDPEEQALFARLSVFRGGCTLEAAEAVCDADFGAMASFVDRSLLRTEERPPGWSRFTMLETIREFALERSSERPNARELRARHTSWCIAVAEEGLAGLKGRDQDLWLDRLEAEHDNLRSALRWSLDEGDPDAALELASLVWEFWLLHGDVNEGHRWLAEALERADDAASEARALAVAGVGWLATEELQWAAIGPNFLDDALRCAEAATPSTRAYLLAFLGENVVDDPDRAWSLCEDAVSIARDSGDRYVVAITLNSLAMVAMAAGDHSTAAALFAEELEVSREIGDRFNEALCLGNLGEMSFITGDLSRAEEFYTEAGRIAEERGDRRHQALALLGLGWIALSEGRHEQAQRLFLDSLVLEREVGSHLTTTSACHGLAGVAAATGRDAKAATLAGIADGLKERFRQPPDLSDVGAHESFLADARARVGDGWDERYAQGRAMELDEALIFALG